MSPTPALSGSGTVEPNQVPLSQVHLAPKEILEQILTNN